ncbi:MAG: dCMP deaminase family protein [Candidatus Magasanikbacteria bacterium]|jgi:dCMP deaminase|nr:dCMP deaminase family protein [Candidatus Magasanikbacteria bacterium]
MTTPYRTNAISWDECFMRMALIIAQRSKDPSTQAGAVITSSNHIVVGMGYNGFPKGVDNDAFPWEREGSLEETKYAYICHSEENAIYNANGDTHGCKVYTTLFPCNECTKTLIQNGIVEVIYQSDKYHDTPVWKASRRMLDAAGVTYRQYSSKWDDEQHVCLR